MPTLSWRALTAAKAGSRPEENEDASAAQPTAGRFAVADGASEGWRSGPWAKHLAAAFAANPPEPGTFADWLAHARQTFRDEPASGMAWYAEVKQAEGAFATLAGVAFRRLRQGAGIGWKGCAVGDGCVFQLRGSKLIASFPMDSAQAFGNRPALVGSASTVAVPEPEWVAGRAEPGDVFYLMTDALAEWFLRRHEADQNPADELETLFRAAPPSRAFQDWLNSSRSDRLIRNDDSTLLRVDIHPAESELPR
jgi:serine/threonine protein phosphatase PrpC